jgi:hypothetical protein
MKLRRYLWRYRIFSVIIAIFMFGVLLGRLSIRYEAIYTFLTFGYLLTAVVGAVAIFHQLRRDEAELRQMMKDVEEALSKEVDND